MLRGRVKTYPVNRLRDQVDHLFGELFSELPGLVPRGLGAGVFPAVNVWDEGTRLMVEAEVPGLKMADLEVLVTGNELTLRGTRKDETPENAGYHRRERGAGAFSRVVTLPLDVDADKVEATLRDGVLTITLPKAEAVRPRKIEVRS